MDLCFRLFAFTVTVPPQGFNPVAGTPLEYKGISGQGIELQHRPHQALGNAPTCAGNSSKICYITMGLDTVAHIETRRYDLDWLRIIAFGLLILYHVGMFFVSWDFHVKSIHAGVAIEPLMKLVNPWRMSILFIISGVAVRYAMDKAPIGRFIWKRFWRLFIPLLFGMLVIVAPQSWLELLEKGEITSPFLEFYVTYLSASTEYSIIVPTWNHLWYLAYLIVYTVILALFSPITKRLSSRNSEIATPDRNKSGLILFFVWFIPTMIFAFHENWLDNIFPTTHALVDDWGTHLLYFPLMFLAFVFAKSVRIWNAIDRLFMPSLIAVFLLAIWQLFVWSLTADDIDGMPYIELLAFFHSMAEPVYAWSAIIVMFKLSKRFPNRSSPKLSYMTEAIFSWYILHQTLIIISGYWLTRQGLPVAIEAFLIILITVLSCALLHDYIIRHNRYLRPLFGLKQKQ